MSSVERPWVALNFELIVPLALGLGGTAGSMRLVLPLKLNEEFTPLSGGTWAKRTAPTTTLVMQLVLQINCASSLVMQRIVFVSQTMFVVPDGLATNRDSPAR